jgi:hypothetical protein
VKTSSFRAFNGLVPNAAILRTIERWQTQVLPKLGLARSCQAGKESSSGRGTRSSLLGEPGAARDLAGSTELDRGSDLGMIYSYR